MKNNNINFYDKYIKYKLKYINLKDVVTEKLTQIKSFDTDRKASLLERSKDTLLPLFCHGIIQFTSICLKLLELYNPESITYVFLGQSPIIINIISEIILQHLDFIDFKYRGLPISGAGGDEYPSKDQMINIFRYFDMFELNTIKGDCIIIDYIESGMSLSKIAHLFNEYIKIKNLQCRLITAVGLSTTGDRIEPKFYPITILHIDSETIEDRAGMVMLAKKDPLLDTIRLYKKKDLNEIIKGDIKQEESPEVNLWLARNLQNIIMTVLSSIDKDTDIVNICKDIPRIDDRRIPRISTRVVDMRKRVFKKELDEGSITRVKYDEEIEQLEELSRLTID